MKNNKLHLTCECHTHELHFESDHELNMWYISFWQRGYGSESSLSYKLKCIWHIIRHGRPYGDEVILNKQDLIKLKEYIDKEIVRE